VKSRKAASGKIDLTALVVTILLIGIGMVMVYSSSMEVARQRFHSPGFFLGKQVLRILLALLFFYIFLNIDYHWLADKYKILIGISVIILVVLLVSNSVMVIKGSRRWISLFGLSLQPSDMARISLIIYTAAMLSRKGKEALGNWEGMISILSAPLLVCMLIILQPDFSTALIIAAIIGIMLFVGGLRFSYIALIGMASVFLAVYGVLKAPYRYIRFKAFLDPEANVAGYQAMQSLIGLGSGGFFGAGLGESSQKLLYLPEPYTDFVFSILGEELGFFGVAAVFILFGILLWRGFRIGMAAPDKLGFYLATGITVMLGLYMIVHAGVVSALLPTTGIPFPFISYGGSNLLFNMIAVGILLNISGQAKRKL
jgi:cell division protein FtsW